MTDSDWKGLNAYMNSFDDFGGAGEAVGPRDDVQEIIAKWGVEKTVLILSGAVDLAFKERDDLRALLAKARPVVEGAVLAMCTPIATPDSSFYSCNFCGKVAADFLDIAHERDCQTRSPRDLLARIDAELALGKGDRDGE